ncbi:SRPBCC family protein [Acrocarpospora corrugata]|uniref:SRPBCC family protein n=1 Tax=Acrocarpospora corrugata TaxID=35763 RepID=UPI0014797F24|nr:SRPBCC family protein [Acrocarpospora corrugata]
MTVDAPVDAVWRVVSDVTRASEWSHECHRVTWLPGTTKAAPGARFRGSNRSGRLQWSRVCEIFAFDAPREIAWRTVPTTLQPDSTDWRITLEPTGDQTRIVQTFQVTSMPRWLDWILTRMNPLHIDRAEALTDDLARIATIAAASPHRTDPKPSTTTS